jgi:protease-4
MAKFLIGLGTGVLVTFLSIFLLFLFIIRFREKPPEVAANSVLVMNLEGGLPEKPPVEIPFIGDDRPSTTVANVWMALKKAAVDKNIRAILLEPQRVGMGWGKLEEVRSGLEQFRKAGKPIYAYLRSPGTREYYLASAADRIYIGPSDAFYVKGLRAEMMYFRSTLDKLGVSIEIEHAGKYKDFGDMFTRTDMSPETKEVMNSVLDSLYGNLVDRIAQGRRKTPDQIRAAIDSGPFLPKQALDAGLVDALRHEDEVWGELKAKLGKDEPKRISLGKYIKVPADSLGLDDKKNIVALVVADGEITRGDSSDDGASEDGITSRGFNRLLRRVGADSTIKGVVVRIDSPGGDSAASDEIWREMRELSKKKPVVISMSDAAASGGYFMAMTGDPVVAYPGTMTGSIGVVFGKPNLHGLYGKLGITKDLLKRGRFADIDSDYRGLEPVERAKLREGVDEVYRDFVSKVADARKRKFEEVEPLAQGRVWLGSQAKGNGLVDELGGLDRAMELVKQKAKIPAGEKVGVVIYPPRRTLVDLLMHRQAEDPLLARLKAIAPGFPLRSMLEGGYLRLAPMVLSVR